MIETVKKRLQSLNYSFQPEDEWLLTYLLKVKTQEILNFCGLKELPPELGGVLTERVCGNFLAQKTLQNPESVGSVVKSIKEGDVTIDYAVSAGNPMTLFAAMAAFGVEEMLCFRQMNW